MNESWFRVSIPTKNSKKWISLVYSWYKEHEIYPFILFDESSEYTTVECLRNLTCRISGVYFPFPRVESIIKDIKFHVGSGWVLRMDDDEIPSPGMLKYLKNIQEPNDFLDSLAFQRRWVRLSSTGALEYANCRLWKDSTGEVGGDRQWRLFHTERVSFDTNIHTPGFIPKKYIIAPDDAYIIHFDWILKNRQQREEKMHRYDAQTPGSGSSNARYYAPESLSPADIAWVPILDKSVRAFCLDVQKMAATS